MEKRRVVITGLGTVNPSGNTVAESWDNIRNGVCKISFIEAFDTTEHKVKIAGEVKNFDPATVMDKKETRKMGRFAHFAVAAALEAVKDSGLDMEKEDRGNVGVIISSGIGSLPTLEIEQSKALEKGYSRVTPLFIPLTIANMAAAQVAIRFGIQGMCTCPVTACAAGSMAIGDAFHRIRDGYEEVFLAGGTEGCLCHLALGGFGSMHALSVSEDPLRASIPFDADRDGFVMGEGSGIVVMESLEHAKARGAKIYAEIVGYGTNCDAYHITAPSPNGVGGAQAMRLTLQDAGVDPTVVDYINAHGTSTPMNDSCETAAIHAVFGDHAKKLAVSSTKSMTGHLLGGAGGIEAIFSVKALEEGFIPPTAGYKNPDPACDLDYVPVKGREANLQYVLSNSLGFGGHNACLLFKNGDDC